MLAGDRASHVCIIVDNVTEYFCPCATTRHAVPQSQTYAMNALRAYSTSLPDCVYRAIVRACRRSWPHDSRLYIDDSLIDCLSYISWCSKMKFAVYRPTCGNFDERRMTFVTVMHSVFTRVHSIFSRIVPDFNIMQLPVLLRTIIYFDIGNSKRCSSRCSYLLTFPTAQTFWETNIAVTWLMWSSRKASTYRRRAHFKARREHYNDAICWIEYFCIWIFITSCKSQLRVRQWDTIEACCLKLLRLLSIDAIQNTSSIL